MLTADIRDARIERYFPDVLANANEFKVLGATVDPELVALWRALWKQMLNTFVYDLDEDGATRWEEMLSIRPAAGASLANRRKAILTRINASVPYTHRAFQNMLDGIYGDGAVTITLNYNGYEIWLDLKPTAITQSQAVRRLARVIVPANLSVIIQQTFEGWINQYVGIAVGYRHKVTIEANDGFSIDDIDGTRYRTAIVAVQKHTLIGGN